MKTIITIIVTFALTLIAFTGPAGAKEPTTPDKVEITADLLPPDDLHIVIVQTWEGGSARDMRQSLDAYFGKATGDLSADEVKRIEQASAQDIRNSSLPFFSFDGLSPALSGVTVTLENAVGPVDSIGVLRIRHELNAKSVPFGDALRIVANTPWNGTLKLTPPPGLAVLDGQTDTAGVLADAKISAGKDMVILLGPPKAAPPEVAPDPTTVPAAPPEESTAPPPIEAESPPTELEPLETPQKIPGATAGVALLAALAGLMIAKRRALGRR